ncbi:MAG: Peptidoglycan-associated lipoprotein precursor [Bacteroidota bacterium]|jgi:hypothetical protein
MEKLLNEVKLHPMKYLFFYLFPTLLFHAWSQNNTEKSTVIVYFDTNQFRITNEHRQQLDSLFPFDKGTGLKHEFHVTGFTDETGPLSFNQWLSEQRACAVADYLESKGSQADYQCIANGNGIYSAAENNAKQRKVMVEHRRIRGCGLMEEKIDTIAFAPPYFKNIAAYFDTKSMIRDRIFAIDKNEKLIKTAGMYLFEPNDEAFKSLPLNTMVRFCFPLAKGKKFDPDMKVWRLVLNEKGEKRWEETTVPVRFNPDSYCYEAVMNCVYLRGERGLNIDKNRPNTEMEIEISFYKNVDCLEVELTDADFSAVEEKRKTNVYEFVGWTLQETGYFKGKFRKNGIEHELSFPLTSCTKTEYPDGSKAYYLSEKSHFWVDGKEFNGPRNLWQRIGDWFRKKENPL